ncbi:MAG: DUF3168 domain-containing protein [Luteimonas sp.]
MAMSPPVYAILSGDAAVTALVPAARIKGQSYAGESPIAPYITWQIISGGPENYLADRPGMDVFRVQIDIWAVSAASAKAIAALVRDALEPHAYCLNIFADDYEPDTKLYRYGYDWNFHTLR